MSQDHADYLDELREIKQKLLPPCQRTFNRLSYSCWHKPDSSGGGDYFDVLELPGETDHYGAIVADVSGHGAAAAVEAAMLDAILRTYPVDVSQGPAHVLNYANRYLFSREIRGHFITAFIMGYDSKTDMVNYVNAGHPPPLLQYTDGHVMLLDGTAQYPLCVDRDHAWTNDIVSTKDVKRIILYTDGIIELRNAKGEQLTVEGLRHFIEGLDTTYDSDSCASLIKDAIKKQIPAEALKNSDDITVLVLDLNP